MRDGGQQREEKGRIQTVNSFPFLGASSTSRGLWKTRRRNRWDRWCGMVFLMIEAEENDTYESQWWRNSEASGLQEGEIREKDGQVWVTGLQVNAAVEATAAPSDGSKSPGTLTPFPFHPHPHLFPNDSSTTSSPPCLHYDSHPLPRLNYCCSPWESSPSIFGYHQTSIWAETSAWLHWGAQLSSFYETTRICSHTRAHRLLALMAL